jgi:hypothetical protein
MRPIGKIRPDRKNESAYELMFVYARPIPKSAFSTRRQPRKKPHLPPHGSNQVEWWSQATYVSATWRQRRPSWRRRERQGLETARAVVAIDGDAVVSCCVLVSDNPPYLPSPLLSLSMVLGSCGRRGSGDVDGLCGRSDASSTPPSPQTTSFAIFIWFGCRTFLPRSGCVGAPLRWAWPNRSDSRSFHQSWPATQSCRWCCSTLNFGFVSPPSGPPSEDGEDESLPRPGLTNSSNFSKIRWIRAGPNSKIMNFGIQIRNFWKK